MPNRFAIEGALERGHLWAATTHGRWWRVRRNGRTKLWKTRPDEFRVPVKAGLRSCGEITHTSVVATMCDDGWRTADFVVSANDPNTCGA